MKKKLPLIISIFVLSLAIFIKISDISLVEQLQLKVFDTFQIKHPRQYTEQPIKIIDIDDESLEKLGQWPWPRSILAEIIDRLNNNGAAAIAMDIVFAEEDRTSPKHILPLWKQTEKLSYLLKELPDHDELFSKAIAKANVVTGFVLTQETSKKSAAPKAGFSYAGNDPSPFLSNFSGYVTTLPDLEGAASGNGALNSMPDKDGILRRMPVVFLTGDKFTPSLSSETLRVAQGASGYVIKSSGASGEQSFGENTGVTAVKIGNFEIPTDPSGKFWIYYSEYRPERYIPAWKILDPNFDTSFLEGQMVFIGTSAAGLRDIRATPLNPTISGVEIHVQALEQVLSGEFLNRPDWIRGAEILMMVIVGVILIIMMNKLSALWGAAFTLIALASAVSFSWYCFIEYRMLIDPITPGIAIVFLYLSESLIRYIGSEKEKKEVRNAFSHYMSPALVAQLAAHPESLKLGGETKNLTLLFCDIRGFTTISENFNAQDLTKFINNFLTPMTTVILDKKGTIDKYMGDCIMAFWNAPLDDPEHPQNACISALQMIKALDVLNIQQEKEAQEKDRKFIPIHIGIGLNTGDCCVGNMGSDQRFDYSVLGDDVNLASRLEGQSKTYGVDIVIGGNTQLAASEFATLELDLIKVKGKTKPVRIYTLLGDNNLQQNPDFKALSELFNDMLKQYRKQDWQSAKALIESCRKQCQKLPNIRISGLFDMYNERIEAFLQSPPTADWDGVYTAESK
jgi:adenylate cyclase